VQKFKHNASRILTQSKTDGAVNTILDLEKLKDISDLTKLITL
jgi:hypothetical protein